MKKHSEIVDRYFRERLERFEQQPSQAVWNQITTKLGHNRKKRAVLVIFRIAASMALLLSLSIGYYFMDRKINRETSPVSSNLQHNNATNEKPVLPKQTAENKTALPVVKNTGSAYRPIPEIKATENLKPSYEKLAAITHSEYQGLIPVTRSGYLLARSVSPGPDDSPDVALTTNPEYGPPEITDPPKAGRWVLGSEVAPLYSYRTISSDNLDPEIINTLNKSESGLLAFAGGLNVSFSPGRRLSVQSGVYYSRYGQEKNKVESYQFNNTEYSGSKSSSGRYLNIANSTGVIYSTQPENGSFDQVVSNSTEIAGGNFYFANLDGPGFTSYTGAEESDINIVQYFDYLEIPLSLKYKIIDRKLDFSVSGGMVTNFLVGNMVKMEQNGEKRRFGKTSGISQINYLGSVGLGLEFPLMTGVAFTFEPRFRYYINPIDKSSQINVHPYSFGIFAGVHYIF